MSDEKHDQNQGLETPDTAPSRMRVIAYAIMGYVLVACIGGFFLYGIDVSDNSSAEPVAPAVSNQGTSSFPPSGYFSNTTNRNLIPQQISLGNLHLATNPTELASVLGTFPETQIIFIDPSTLDNEEYVDLLKSQFESGKMIVGLRTPHALLSEKLGFTPQLPELTLSETASSVIWISAWYLDEDGQPAEIAQSWDQFPSMLTNLHILAQASQN